MQPQATVAGTAVGVVAAVAEAVAVGPEIAGNVAVVAELIAKAVDTPKMVLGPAPGSVTIVGLAAMTDPRTAFVTAEAPQTLSAQKTPPERSQVTGDLTPYTHGSKNFAFLTESGLTA